MTLTTPLYASWSMLGRSWELPFHVWDLGSLLPEQDEPEFSEDIIDGECDAPAERAWLVDVAALDLKCTKYITPRFTEADIAPAVEKLIKRIHDLGAQLELAAYSKPR